MKVHLTRHGTAIVTAQTRPRLGQVSDCAQACDANSVVQSPERAGAQAK